MHLFSTLRSVIVKQSASSVIVRQTNSRSKKIGSSVRFYAASSVTPVIPLQLPSVSSYNSRSLGTLQQQQLKTDNEKNHDVNSSSSSINENVYNLLSKDVIDYVSLKSLFVDNPEVRRFLCKIFEADNHSSSDASSQYQHPFIQVAGNLFFQEDDFPSSLNTLGILVFLMGKLFQTSSYSTSSTYEEDSVRTKKLMLLAKGINQSSAAFRIHRTIQETSPAPLWNKLATLAGDLLVVECIRNVSSIGDNTLLLWTMNSLADFSSSEFQNLSTTSPTSSSHIFTPEGSLLSTGFRGVASLYGHGSNLNNSSNNVTANSNDMMLAAKLDRLGISLGSLWMDQNKDEQNMLTIVKESLEILSQFPDNDFNLFFKDFLLAYGFGNEMRNNAKTDHI